MCHWWTTIQMLSVTFLWHILSDTVFTMLIFFVFVCVLMWRHILASWRSFVLIFNTQFDEFQAERKYLPKTLLRIFMKTCMKHEATLKSTKEIEWMKIMLSQTYLNAPKLSSKVSAIFLFWTNATIYTCFSLKFCTDIWSKGSIICK